MDRVEKQAKREWRFPWRRPCPDDFAETFVRIGRLACEEHYGARRTTIAAWLEECGKDALTERRRAAVREHRRQGMTRREMQAIFERAFPLPERGFVNPRTAQAAARFLQQIRNGGWIITRAPNGMWRVGLKLLTAGELVDLAKAKGFRGEAE